MAYPYGHPVNPPESQYLAEASLLTPTTDSTTMSAMPDPVYIPFEPITLTDQQLCAIDENELRVRMRVILRESSSYRPDIPTTIEAQERARLLAEIQFLSVRKLFLDVREAKERVLWTELERELYQGKPGVNITAERIQGRIDRYRELEMQGREEMSNAMEKSNPSSLLELPTKTRAAITQQMSEPSVQLVGCHSAQSESANRSAEDDDSKDVETEEGPEAVEEKVHPLTLQGPPCVFCCSTVTKCKSYQQDVDQLVGAVTGLPTFQQQIDPQKTFIALNITEEQLQKLTYESLLAKRDSILIQFHENPTPSKRRITNTIRLVLFEFLIAKITILRLLLPPPSAPSAHITLARVQEALAEDPDLSRLLNEHLSLRLKEAEEVTDENIEKYLAERGRGVRLRLPEKLKTRARPLQHYFGDEEQSNARIDRLRYACRRPPEDPPEYRRCCLCNFEKAVERGIVCSGCYQSAVNRLSTSVDNPCCPVYPKFLRCQEGFLSAS
ncbi:hypothetical protein V8F20_001874 [Naviculisporaceae sp. PSN 640]